MRAIKIRIHGKVQGVWFRKYTRDKCEALKISGWVRNYLDGTVHIVAQGKGESLDELIRWCHIGSPEASVTKVETQEIEVGIYEKFEIRD